MKNWFIAVILGLASCVAFAADKKPVLMGESTKKSLLDAKKPIDDLNKKQEELRKEFQDLQKRATALQDEFNKIEVARPTLQRKYDAVLETAFKSVSLENEEDEWEVDLAKGVFSPKSSASAPAPPPTPGPGPTK